MNTKNICAFKTVSGSVYEVNLTDKKIRRLNGSTNPTARQGKDGDWKEFANITRISIGHPVFITWTAKVPVFVPGALAAATATSIVKEILVESMVDYESTTQAS